MGDTREQIDMKTVVKKKRKREGDRSVLKEKKSHMVRQTHIKYKKITNTFVVHAVSLCTHDLILTFRNN